MKISGILWVTTFLFDSYDWERTPSDYIIVMGRVKGSV